MNERKKEREREKSEKKMRQKQASRHRESTDMPTGRRLFERTFAGNLDGTKGFS